MPKQKPTWEQARKIRLVRQYVKECLDNLRRAAIGLEALGWDKDDFLLKCDCYFEVLTKSREWFYERVEERGLERGSKAYNKLHDYQIARISQLFLELDQDDPVLEDFFDEVERDILLGKPNEKEG